MATPLSFEVFGNIIDGKVLHSATTRHTLNPATLEENAEAPLSTVDDVNKTVEAAQKAAKLWGETSWENRREALSKFIQAFEEHRNEFAQLLNKEQGKSVRIPPKNQIASFLIDTRFSGHSTRSTLPCTS